jgi:hypothetical protein
MSSASERLSIAESNLGFEAHREKNGRLALDKLPQGHGGGSYEVAE